MQEIGALELGRWDHVRRTCLAQQREVNCEGVAFAPYARYMAPSYHGSQQLFQPRCRAQGRSRPRAVDDFAATAAILTLPQSFPGSARSHRKGFTFPVMLGAIAFAAPSPWCPKSESAGHPDFPQTAGFNFYCCSVLEARWLCVV